MSWFAGRGVELQETLRAVVRRWRAIRCLVLVDAAGLPLAASMASRALEERLAALAAASRDLMVRAHGDVETGPLHWVHIAGADRQILVLPIDHETLLAAVVEADASIHDVGRQLAGTARAMLAGAWPPTPWAP
jgi:predicted regulator of Ras-like GTPase activity (Roadblock/LC7/MglB family)